MAPMGIIFLMYALCSIHKNEGMRVDLTRQNLTDVPGDFDVNVTEVDLSKNEITHITNNSFMLYNQLIRISLHDNDLIIIEDGSFDHNAKLKYLDLSDNSTCASVFWTSNEKLGSCSHVDSTWQGGG